MRSIPRPVRLVVLALGILALPGFSPLDQQELTDAERAFREFMANSSWKGHWYRLTKEGLVYGGEDGYRILRAERIAKGHWVIVAEFKLQGKPMRFSIPAQVVFAGDAAVIYLDGLRLPGEPPFSFRVVFQRDAYAGVFSSEPLSGVVLGARVRSSQERR